MGCTSTAQYEFEGVSVKVEKPPTPVLWLDTFVFIKLGKIAVGGELPEPSRSRVETLLSLVEEKVDAGRLLCIEGEQDEEIDSRRQEGAAAREILARVTRGTRIRPHQEVEQKQLLRMAESYIRGDDHAVMPWSDVFCDADPNPVPDPASEDRCFRTRAQLRDDLDELRLKVRSIGRTFEQQRDLEFRHIEDLFHYLEQESSRRGMFAQPTSKEASAILYIHGLLTAWKSAGGTEEGFIQFLSSSYFRAIPVHQLYSNLYADLITGNEVESGDAFDFHHASASIPYCHYVLVCKTTRNRVQKLGIDKQFTVSVFSEQTISDLFTELQRL